MPASTNSAPKAPTPTHPWQALWNSPPDGPDLWKHHGPDGQSIPAALRYLVRFFDPQVTWPYPELHPKSRSNALRLVWQADALPDASDLPPVPPPTPEQRRELAWLQYGKP